MCKKRYQLYVALSSASIEDIRITLFLVLDHKPYIPCFIDVAEWKGQMIGVQTLEESNSRAFN